MDCERDWICAAEPPVKGVTDLSDEFSEVLSS